MADTQLPTRETAIAVRPESIRTPLGKTELRGMRTTHGKQFLHPEKAPNGDNVITCETRIGAVCYRDDNGELRSIDTTVRDLGGVIGVEWAPYKMVLHATGIGFDFWPREGGEVSIKLTGIGGEKFNQDAAMKPDITDNVITFRDVRPGCDIVFTCLNQRVKTLRILHDDKSPRTFEWAVTSDRPELIDATLTGTDAAKNHLELESSVVDGVISETWTGKVKVIDDPATRVRSLSSEAVYPVEIDPTVNSSIGAGSNDGYGYGTSGWLGAGQKMNFGKGAGGNHYDPGMRFTSLAIPQAATISSAILTLHALTSSGSGGAGTIFGRAADNPSDFNSANNPFSVTKTSASTAVSASTSSGNRTYDITAIVQEIVNRGGWSSSNAMAFPMVGTGANGNTTYFDAYEYSGTDQASLSITYTAGGGVRTQTIIHNRAVHRAANW